ncbi:MAG: hypothetical protein HRT68_05200, partial [Flavobacteriaceae bacterium]|nr:hypothetical protein [Flavobacteriaceae bacterium]
YTYNNIDYSWYQVEYKGKKGFIVGGLLSLKRIKENDHVFLFSLRKEKKEDHQVILLTRVIDNAQLIEEKEFRLSGNEFELSLLGNNGLPRLDNILKVDYFSEACGQEGGYTYIFWFENELTHIADLSQIVDADIYSFSEEFKFIGDKIKFTRVSYVLEDEESKHEVTREVSLELTWDGEKLTPEIPKFSD